MPPTVEETSSRIFRGALKDGTVSESEFHQLLALLRNRYRSPVCRRALELTASQPG